jgi:hypothetical protein
LPTNSSAPISPVLEVGCNWDALAGEVAPPSTPNVAKAPGACWGFNFKGEDHTHTWSQLARWNAGANFLICVAVSMTINLVFCFCYNLIQMMKQNFFSFWSRGRSNGRFVPVLYDVTHTPQHQVLPRLPPSALCYSLRWGAQQWCPFPTCAEAWEHETWSHVPLLHKPPRSRRMRVERTSLGLVILYFEIREQRRG